jgi:hypothetical protein
MIKFPKCCKCGDKAHLTFGRKPEEQLCWTHHVEAMVHDCPTCAKNISEISGGTHAE